jgi:copper resistance protein B
LNRAETDGHRLAAIGHQLEIGHQLAAIGHRLAVALLVLAALLMPAPAFAQQADWPAPVHDDQVFWFLFFKQLEFASTSAPGAVTWDVQGWIGDDYNRFWLKSEGDRTNRAGAGDFEVQALYSRLLTPYWDIQAGVRYDRQLGPGPNLQRAHLVIGFEGLAPYWWEMEPVLFISEDGDVSARVGASYDLLLTQRLILQPQVEVNLAASTVEEWGVGSGLGDVSVDLRLRYEIRRGFAPYLGVSWFQRFGATADLARNEGADVAELAILGGVRIWF